jgi:hypothetical protein
MPAYNRKWTDLPTTGAQAVGIPKFAQPFSGDNTSYVLTQEWECLAENFSPLALNTAHPDYPTFLLANESPLQDLGNACVRWTRTYALVPNTRNDGSTITYNFIGYVGYEGFVNTAPVAKKFVGRNRFQRTVPCRVQWDYFLLSGNNVLNSAGSTVATNPSGATVHDIPVILEQLYYTQQGQYISGVWTPDYPTGSAQDIAFGLATDFIVDIATWNSLFTTAYPTVPSRTQYQALVNAGSEIVAETSNLERWIGNIFSRATKYVIAL